LTPRFGLGTIGDSPGAVSRSCLHAATGVDGCRMLPIRIAVLLSLAVASVAARPRADCVTFRSEERLRAGTAFSAPLPHGLRLRLVPENGNAPALPSVWRITVTSPEGTTDYVWPVSPPFRTAPHLYIGQTYGWTARESVSVERQLRFVLDDRAYEAAVEIAQGRDPGDVERSLAQFGRGTLRLKVTGYSLASAVEGASLEWITFEGGACVARER
jgi:hypothetical protein